MSASARTPKWRFWLQKIALFLFRRCIGYNMHWAWDRTCYCAVGDNGHGIMLRTHGNRWVDLGTSVSFAGPTRMQKGH